ncbi:MAG: endolytic transglycosylase MltG [Gammaproteobacteria bacterium]
MRSLVEFIVVIAIAALFGAKWLYGDYQKAINDPVAVGDQSVSYVVEPGATFRTVANDVKKNGWWPHPSRYLLWRIDRRQLAGKLKSGEYEIKPGMSIDEFTDLLVSGKTRQYKFTLLEGWTFAQVRAAIQQSDILQHTIPKDADDATVMVALDLPGKGAEGRFFPDTYSISRTTTDKELLKRAYDQMQSTLDAAWSNRSNDVPYKDLNEALTMASIVEKETGIAEERPKIAGVFVQRLKKGMKLQTDPTVIYGIGKDYDGNIRKKDLETDTPYNTYTRVGLPPTPIAMPGKESIEAALHPDTGEALYFVARGDGGHYFSKTLEEHNAAVRKYQLGHAQDSGKGDEKQSDTNQTHSKDKP